MGELQGMLFQPEFNRSIRVEARPERLTADAGAVLGRVLMDRTGLSGLLREHLTDPRDPGRVVHPYLELLRTAVLLPVQGWSDQADTEVLRTDPAFRLAVSGRRGQRPLREAEGREPEGLCSQPTLSRLVAGLASEANRQGLADVLLSWAEPRVKRRGQETLVVDLDSVPVEVYGHQPGSAYNGHYGVRCYHPLVVRTETGEYLGAKLRPGNAHTADGGLAFVRPILKRAQAWAEDVWLRIDAGFPGPTLLSSLEAEGVSYVARLRSNRALARQAAPYLRRPPGRPPAEGRTWLHELSYRAGTWKRERRVVLVVLERPERKTNEDGSEQLHLFLDHFFLLTNAPADQLAAEDLLARYRQRGAAEKDFGDWKNALELALSSSPRPKTLYGGRPVEAPYTEPDSFGANEVRLLLSLLAANLLDRGREVLEIATRETYSRGRFRQLLLRTAGRVLLKSNQVTLVIAKERAPLWTAFWRQLDADYPARGSPPPPLLPQAA